MDTLRAIVAIHRASNSVAPLPDDDELWSRIPDDVAEMFVAMAADPLHFDHRVWAARGVLVEESAIAPTDLTAKFYMRVWELTTALPLEVYLGVHPGDAPHTAIMLHACGASVDDIEDTLVASLERHHHDEAARKFAAGIKEDVGISCLDTATPDAPITVIYGGTTVADTATGRATDDSAENGVTSRRKNYEETAKTLGSSLLAMRTDTRVSSTEDTLIAAMDGLSVNAVRGGRGGEYLPSLAVRQVVDSALLLAGPHNLGTEEDPVLVSEVHRYLRDKVEYFRAHPEYPSELSSRAFASVAMNAADCLHKMEGVVLAVTLMKDITAESFHGLTGGIRDQTVGRDAIRVHPRWRIPDMVGAD
ncbi:hypothetical protein PLICRDRAFT_181098 [Plicaturopsis crispa FD-325 SS-3]|uniref:Uncharacterized protein n=1 Tax=Plicaturopsis crispa FD-325 SS-3 TaxID=944288 RepID=A0A0C9T0V7_PLICR|nr:hypothetical protein PLICRDRAFT_181098 [Plicaturopsis crispa FD-325 SS-3]